MSKNTKTEAAAKDSDYRLPKTVVPSKYEITICPDFRTFRFTGQETIDVTVLEPVSEIRLNAKELKIKSASVSNDSGTTLDGAVSLNAETEMAVIAFAGMLGAGQWHLKIEFAGTLNDKLKGFYRSIWTDKDGGKHTIATTQFESTDARRAFPCFDEPACKATFKLKLVVPDNFAAVSNGRLLSETPVSASRRKEHGGAGKKICEFACTMKMSTYLNAFIAGELEHSEPVWVNGKELKVWCTPGKKHLTRVAVKFASRALAKLEWYMGMPYPGGDKIDLLALPDFAAGAMENLGCITFRETALLADETTATHAELKRVAEVIVHELVHMWFGDLVTMAWWTWLWLNESFATFLENLILSLLEPHWNIFDEFAISRAAAMRLDALGSTHAIECPVNHPEEVEELFDLISYEKGCSVLYMIHQYIGFENFRQGVNLYLTRHAFGNAEGVDFWQALEDACRGNGLSVPVVDIMTRWVSTPGHPVIAVAQTDMEGFVRLTQSHFTFLPEASDSGRLWPVPVHIRVKTADGSVNEQKLLLTGKSQTVFLGDKCRDVIVNAGGSGFYRVRYRGELLGNLTGNVQKMSVVERFNLVNDTWSCVRAGLVDFPAYLQFVGFFAGESDPNVWSIISGSLAALMPALPEGRQAKLAEFARNLMKPAMNCLGYAPKPGDSLDDKQVRALLFAALGTYAGDTAVQAKARELFAAYKADKSTVDSEMLASVVSVVAYTGNKNDYEEFLSLLKSAATPQDEQRYRNALARFQKLELLERTLAMTITGEIRSQDAPYLVASVMGNPAGAQAAWSFFKQNFNKMVKMYPGNGIVRLCGAVTILDTPELFADVKAFFAAHKVRSGEMAVKQAIEQLHVNVLLRQRLAKLESDRYHCTGGPAATHERLPVLQSY